MISRDKLTRLAWEVTRLQQEMLDALGPAAQPADNENSDSSDDGEQEEQEEEKEERSSSDSDDGNEGELSSKRAKLTPFADIDDEDTLLTEMDRACRQHHKRSVCMCGCGCVWMYGRVWMWAWMCVGVFVCLKEWARQTGEEGHRVGLVGNKVLFHDDFFFH